MGALAATGGLGLIAGLLALFAVFLLRGPDPEGTRTFMGMVTLGCAALWTAAAVAAFRRQTLLAVGFAALAALVVALIAVAVGLVG